MKKPFPLLALALALVFVLFGCGGSSNDEDNRFAGTYTGGYASTLTTDDEGGTLELTVPNGGAVTGAANDSRYGNGVVNVSSRIQRDGDVVLQLDFPAGSPSPTTTFYRTATSCPGSCARGRSRTPPPSSSP